MANPVQIGRLRKIGGANYLAIPAEHMQHLRWNRGDSIAFRLADGKLILERIPVESLAKIRAHNNGESTPEKE